MIFFLEIREYAVSIGIDPDQEHELMWIAQTGIVAPLPDQNWDTLYVEMFYSRFQNTYNSFQRKLVVGRCIKNCHRSITPQNWYANPRENGIVSFWQQVMGIHLQYNVWDT